MRLQIPDTAFYARRLNFHLLIEREFPLKQCASDDRTHSLNSEAAIYEKSRRAKVRTLHLVS